MAAAGLQAAFTVGSGIVRPDTDPYRLPCLEILGRDGAGLRFLIKVAWGGGSLTVRGPRDLWRSARRHVRHLLANV